MIACVVICDTFSLPFTKLMKGCYNMPCMLVLFRWVCFVSLGVVQNVLTFANKLNTRRFYELFS